MLYLEIMPGLADHSQEPPAWLLCQIKATITLADKRQLECIHEKRNRLVSLSIPTPVYFLPKTVLRQKLRWTAYKWGLGDQWSTEAKAAFWELNISRKISMFKAQYNFFSLLFSDTQNMRNNWNHTTFKEDVLNTVRKNFMLEQ